MMPNYLQRLADAAASFEKGQAYYIEVMHDADCGIYKGKPCGCACDITVSRSDGRKFSLCADGTLTEVS